MKPVYVFPGEGSQHRGMGEGLFEKYPDLVAHADECLGYSIQELCLQDPRGLLNNTQYTHPALYVVNILSYVDRVSRERQMPGFFAGHGLGEYCALFAAGAFDFDTGLKLVCKRGELMSRAPRGGMAVIANLTHDRVDKILSSLPYRHIDIAYLNSRTQSALAGPDDELFAPGVKEAFTLAGAQFVRLNVSAPLHSRCLAEVEREFAHHLSQLRVRELNIPVVANYTGRPYPPGNYVHYLALQISNPVRWYESISWLIRCGLRDFHEIGPGNVLTVLNKHIVQDPLPMQEGCAGQDAECTNDAGELNGDCRTALTGT